MTSAITRQLLLVRHAKALEDVGEGDHARPLAPRGHEQAQALSAWLSAEALVPDLALCSTAQRTRETLAALPRQISRRFEERLYLAMPSDIIGLIEQAGDEVRRLMVIGHNPGMHGVLNLLTVTCADPADEERLVLKFPTCACALLTFNVASWREVGRRMGTLQRLRWPGD